MNHTAWPARTAKDVEYRYYFDVFEVLAAGLSIDDIKVEGKSQQYSEGEQGYATVSGPYKYEGDATGNTYYALIKFEDGRAIQPTGQSEHRDEVQFRVSIPDAVDGKSTAGAWDTSNDWSYEGLEDATDLKKADSLNDHITMYVNGVLVWGTEPDGTVPTKSDYVPTRSGQGASGQPGTTGTTTTSATVTTTTTTSEPVSSDTEGLRGDANCDTQVNMADAVLIMQSIANPDKYGEGKPEGLTAQGAKNADVEGEGDGVTNKDALLIQKFKLNLVDSL